ncbi:MAG: hypothetical protein K0B09_12435 [Bacteroidales bacterium]|nr:hypothetical protein [Bacteroidales bacterium]
MKKILLVSLLVSALFLPGLSAQAFEERDVKDMTVKERFFLGGFLGLQLGTQTAINVSPLLGYRFSNRLSAGVGGTYQYYNDRFFGQSNTTHLYGFSLFSRFRVIPRAFIHAEYERLSLRSRVEGPGFEQGPRSWEENIFLGGGYRQPLSDRVSLNIMLLYNFNENSQAYYQNPIFRVGVDVSL